MPLSIEGLELVISLKYPEKASQIIGVINQIKDIALLKKLKEMIAESYTPSEIMAWLVSNEPEKMYSSKLNLIRDLYRKGYSRKEVIDLFAFI